jgi:outer membrane protein OmpA-like peptidoglycan-associated protein
MLFDSDSDMLDPEGEAIAQRLGQQLAQLEITRVRIEGHTDSTGSEAYNLALSLRRAQAVQRAMVAAGLQDADIQALGLGKTAPVNDNRTPEQRQQNRRVAIVLPAH